MFEIIKHPIGLVLADYENGIFCPLSSKHSAVYVLLLERKRKKIDFSIFS